MKRIQNAADISRVIITGGRETGGVQSFAVTLAQGFADLGIHAEVIPPGEIYTRWRDLRDRSVLKILSTTAVFAAPFSRRTICMAHGFPRADAQGWRTTLGVLMSFKIASICRNSCLVAVSYYSSAQLKAVYRIDVNEVIHNPLNPLFEPPNEEIVDRCYLTYVGRLHPAKNVHRLLPAMQSVLDGNPELRICVVGDGVLKNSLHECFGHDARIEFFGDMDSVAVRNVLRKTRVFISGNEMEPFGITYLEALSQGCSVVMPACGGGLEIAPDLIGGQIQLMPLSFDRDEIAMAIRQAMKFYGETACPSHYDAKHAASRYIAVAAIIP